MEKNESPKSVQLYEGDGVEIVPEFSQFTFECCHCGFRHEITVERTEQSVILRFHSINDHGGTQPMGKWEALLEGERAVSWNEWWSGKHWSMRSEELRVGKGCRSRWSPGQ